MAAKQNSSKSNGLDTLEHNVKESREGREELKTAIIGVQAQTSELQKMNVTMAETLQRLVKIEERRS